ncbi:hypothetical protein JCM10207_004748 [Rhodosporidiobolus poonsookiae]
MSAPHPHLHAAAGLLAHRTSIAPLPRLFQNLARDLSNEPVRHGMLLKLEEALIARGHWLVLLDRPERFEVAHGPALVNWVHSTSPSQLMVADFFYGISNGRIDKFNGKEWKEEYAVTFSNANLWKLQPKEDGTHELDIAYEILNLLWPVEILKIATGHQSSRAPSPVLPPPNLSRMRVSALLSSPDKPGPRVFGSHNQQLPGEPSQHHMRSLGQLSHRQAHYYRKRNAFD